MKTSFSPLCESEAPDLRHESLEFCHRSVFSSARKFVRMPFDLPQLVEIVYVEIRYLRQISLSSFSLASCWGFDNFIETEIFEGECIRVYCTDLCGVVFCFLIHHYEYEGHHHHQSIYEYIYSTDIDSKQ